jgi:glycosyltransferase involved in cell wall biosynthesis
MQEAGRSCNSDRLPITVLVAVKNEALNLPHCLASVVRAQRSIVLDSNSTDGTQAIARMHGAELVQFDYRGGYPRKRQWALDSLAIGTPWILLLDADEAVPEPLWYEIGRAITRPDAPDAFLIMKSFHFLGRRFRHGGFSHAAVVLFRKGAARFERLFDDDPGGLDMEVHERVLVEGRIAPSTPRSSMRISRDWSPISRATTDTPPGRRDCATGTSRKGSMAKKRFPLGCLAIRRNGADF